MSKREDRERTPKAKEIKVDRKEESERESMGETANMDERQRKKKSEKRQRQRDKMAHMKAM